MSESRRIACTLYDGVHPLGNPATLTLGDDGVTIEARHDPEDELATSAYFPFSALTVSARIANAPRFITLPDERQVQCEDEAWLDALPQDDPSERPLDLLERRWWVALLATFLNLSLLAYIWLDGFDRLAAVITDRISPSWEEQLGDNVLGAMEVYYLRPSTIPTDRHMMLQRRFDELTAVLPRQGCRLLLRSSETLGANAFALPGRFIIVTDDLLHVVTDDEEVLAIIAHELGHIEHRHALRNIVHHWGTDILQKFISGEVRSIASETRLAALLVNRSHSRDMERDADAFAVALLCRFNLRPELFASGLERLVRAIRDDNEGDWSFLSTHPSASERAQVARSWKCP